ncbi:MAG TPA: ATP synthase F0 subunit B [Acidobacteriota bacterium]|nr:ATP synthase F0 subunit B [Acidobacteriota bacterium]
MNVRKPRLFISAAFLAIAGSAAFPATALAAEESEPWGAWLSVGRVFNLLLVVAVLILLTRKPLSNFLASRSDSIREQLAEAQKARAEAEARLAEVQSRMSRLDDELKEIASTAEKVAQEEYGRMLAQAEADAEKIVERSRQEIEGMTRTAQQELKLHAAELSVRLAEEKIQSEISAADHERLLNRFVSKLGGKP